MVGVQELKGLLVELLSHKLTRQKKRDLWSLMQSFLRKDFEDRAHPFRGSLMILVSQHT